MLELRTFGGLSIQDGGTPITGAGSQRKSLALLALLAAAGKNGLSRDKVIAYLWPDSDTEHGRNLLKQACFALRRDLQQPDLFLGTTELRLNLDVLTSDAQAFEDALRRGDAEGAVRAYAGPFLDGFFISGAPEFEHWVDAERARLKHCACEALEALATGATARGDLKTSVTWWRRLAALDLLNARIARALMGALAATGDRAGALQHARIYEALLRQELDTAPDPAVTEFVRQLREAPEPRAPTVAAREVAPDRALPDTPPAEPSSVGVPTQAGDGVVPDAQPTESPGAAVPGAPRSRPAFRVGRWPAVAAALTAVLAGVLYSRFKTDTALDPDLVAVAPFDVLAPNLELWREGLADVLSRNLDGVAPLRTVSPTVVIHRWHGHGDPASAKNLSRGIGARFVVYGQVLGGGRDSVRLRATVLDARYDRALAEIDRSDEALRVDRLSDSLTVDVIRALTPATLGIHVRLHSVGTRSLAALRAFLQGEAYLRRFSLDSAITSYDRAIALDTTFALALRRLDFALGWNDQGRPGLVARAAASNHGLGPRDSLLVASDTAGARRRFALLEEVAHRYPEDPEAWDLLGEVGFHWGFFVGSTWNDARAAFDRAIALDSAFAPAYVHPIEIALNDNEPGAALRYVRGLLAVSSATPDAAGMRLLGELLNPQRTRPRDFDRVLETASRPALYHVALAVQSWPDADETQIQVARRAVATGRAWITGATPADTGNDVRVYLAMLPTALIYRGHLREARSVVGDRYSVPFMELAEMGAIPRDTVEAVVAQWFHHPHDQGFSFFPWFADAPCHRTLAAALWWAARSDTASLQRLVRREESATRAAKNVAVAVDAPVPGFARAALALAQGDTTLALSRFLAFPDSVCLDPRQLREVRFRLLAATGRSPEAAAVFDRSHERRVPLLLERARLAERVGDRATAGKFYGLAAQAWLHADPELQPYVAEARAGLERLNGRLRR